MRLDNNWQVPEGFVAVKNYPDGINGVTVVGRVELLLSGKRGVQFWVGEGCEQVPVLPIKTGEMWHRGWDIPTQWAIDANKQCWMDDAHGNCLHPVKPEDLLKTAEEQSVKQQIKRILGLQLEEVSCPHCNGTGRVLEQVLRIDGGMIHGGFP